MSGTTKRLDIQFGAFACSVQGFDDPVLPVQQVLQALQNLLEETPELGDAGIQFDAGAIERLIGEVARRADLDERNIEIVPGLIIVHRGDASAPGSAEVDDYVRDQESEGWAHFDASGADRGGIESRKMAKPEDTGDTPAYVNIFSSSTASDGNATANSGSGLFSASSDYQPDPTDDRDADDQPGDHPVQNVFADADSTSDGDIFADLMAEDGEAESKNQRASINFFSDQQHMEPEADDIGSEPVAIPEAPVEPGAERGESLFGGSDEQPDVVDIDEGYTAAGLAQVAEAKSVAELIVSAAAWMVLIQGKHTFSRSEVVDVFEKMPGEHEKTLEARIKGFGKAVRNGQLVLIEAGVFGLSNTELERFQRLL